jgi:hypothetical protein
LLVCSPGFVGGCERRTIRCAGSVDVGVNDNTTRGSRRQLYPLPFSLSGPERNTDERMPPPGILPAAYVRIALTSPFERGPRVSATPPVPPAVKKQQSVKAQRAAERARKLEEFR